MGAGKAALNNQASTLGDYGYGDEDYGDEDFTIETVSHKCAQEVSAARCKVTGMTQEKLAAACSLKTSVVVDIENGTAKYNATQINSIEKALGCKINRHRNKKKSKK